MLYLIFRAYDDFSSFGKIPLLLKKEEGDAIAYCKLLNSDLGIDYIENEELNGNPKQWIDGVFYEELGVE